jgi:hypothetical protein
MKSIPGAPLFLRGCISVMIRTVFPVRTVAMALCMVLRRSRSYTGLAVESGVGFPAWSATMPPDVHGSAESSSGCVVVCVVQC